MFPEKNDSARLKDLGFIALLLIKADCYRFIFDPEDYPSSADLDTQMAWQFPRLAASCLLLRSKYDIDIKGMWFSFGDLVAQGGKVTCFAITVTKNHDDMGCWTMDEILKSENQEPGLESWAQITDETLASFEAMFGDDI